MEHPLNLASAELSFSILISYLAGKCRTYPQITIDHLF
jgi:hypothetical protein